MINTDLPPGDFTVKQKEEVSRPLTVISADLAKLTVDVFWGGGEMVRREKLKCPREIISLYSLYLSLKDCSGKLSCVLYVVFFLAWSFRRSFLAITKIKKNWQRTSVLVDEKIFFKYLNGQKRWSFVFGFFFFFNLVTDSSVYHSANQRAFLQTS